MQFLGVSEGQMQMGHMRFEPNINLHITDQDGQLHKTAITEIKNLNSFSVLERARIMRFDGSFTSGSRPAHSAESARWGGMNRTALTFVMRDKEEAHDYRYFPDPDLPPVEVDDAWLARIKSEMSELPAARGSATSKCLVSQRPMR